MYIFARTLSPPVRVSQDTARRLGLLHILSSVSIDTGNGVTVYVLEKCPEERRPSVSEANSAESHYASDSAHSY